MMRNTMVTLAVLAAMATPTVRAEAPPEVYDEIRRKAQEALLIEVESVSTKTLKEGVTQVEVTARVVAVERTKAALEKGGKVTIRYETRDYSKGPVPPGPSQVPILKKGDFYPAFLNKEEGKTDFAPAADGMSFTMTPAA
jgi:hypothetical protein